jgi:hypothetical protein
MSIHHQLPLWLVGLFIIIILLAALEFGYRVGLSRRQLWKDADSGDGRLVLTSMFALLGLMLAFTYGAGVSRFDTNKLVVNQEANAIRDVYMRAALIREPRRSAELKRAILDYARTRIIKPGELLSNERLQELIQETKQAQKKLWLVTQRTVKQSPSDLIAMPLLIASVNQVINVHTLRVSAFTDKLPPAVLLMLLFTAASTLSVAGFNAGILGRMSRWRMGTLALVLMGVIVVIHDFDHPAGGFIRISQDSIFRVINGMEADLAQ